MGKKDKKGDKAKKEEKKAKKELKQQKSSLKRAKKEKGDDEEDIETIISQFQAKEDAKTAVSITVSAPPSPRTHFTMTVLPNGELLMFGGEFCDGAKIEVFNDLYRWNIEKNEWKKIESLNTPPPRCSHQAVAYRDKVYVFGGEYGTLDQFHHYQDMWVLDLKTNVWTEIKPTGDCPSARSGHRMVVYRNYIVMFGGFYEAMREAKWFNDLYLYSFVEERWMLVSPNPHTLVPRCRSGALLCIHQTDETMYIYGGFSKEKMANATTKNEGKVHEDMWQISLKHIVSSIVNHTVDPGKVNWQKISKKGEYPSPRCGAVMNIYKNKAVLFGGVYDIEGPRHTLHSSFFNDIFAFDMERKRWYKLGLKQQKRTSCGLKKKKKKKKKKEKENMTVDMSDDEDEDEGGDGDEDDDDAESEDRDGENQSCFAYIDESGNVVYMDLGDGESDIEHSDADGINSIGDISLKLATTELGNNEGGGVGSDPNKESTKISLKHRADSAKRRRGEKPVKLPQTLSSG